MKFNDYINILQDLFSNYIGSYDYKEGNVIRYLYCPLECKGYSKHKKGHFEVNFDLGVCYCHRCYTGTTLNNVISEFEKSDYIDNILKYYDKFYEYKSNKKKTNVVDFELSKYVKKNEYNLSNTIKKYLSNRFQLNKIDDIEEICHKFNLLYNKNYIGYYTYYGYKKIIYKVNDDLTYKKFKLVNKNNNNYFDYYYNNISYNNRKLVISEGIFELITFYLNNHNLYSESFNYLCLCGKNIRYLNMFLYLIGKVYYDTIYMIVDNDINIQKYTKNIKHILSNYSYNPKYKMYGSLYIVRPKLSYIDLNEQYMNNDTTFVIDKLI